MLNIENEYLKMLGLKESDDMTSINIAKVKSNYVKAKKKLDELIEEAEENDNIELVEKYEEHLEQLDKAYMNIKKVGQPKISENKYIELFGKLSAKNPEPTKIGILTFNLKEVNKLKDVNNANMTIDIPNDIKTELRATKSIYQTNPTITFMDREANRMFEVTIRCK